jgi:sugar phosphate isomerase/epimerase
MERRRFLTTLSGAMLAAAGSKAIARGLTASGAAFGKMGGSHRFKGPYGLELYSVRNQLDQDVPGALEMVARAGYTDVEAVWDHWGHVTAEQLGDACKKAALNLISLYYPDDQFEQHLDEIIQSAHHVGAKYLICGNVPGAFEGKTVPFENFQQAAANFNRWGAKIHASGLQLAYHNHDYEFRLYNGKPAYDTLIEDTDPKLVAFEMDVFWVKRGGQDPVAYLKKYPHRIQILHLKDMRAGTPIGDFSVGTSDEASVILGKGILDFPAILHAAEKDGVKLYFVEDESAEAPENIGPSLEYLKKVRF